MSRLQLFFQVIVLGILITSFSSCDTESASQTTAAPLATPEPLIKTGVSPRIITVGGDITEIVYALGMGENVVAADESSQFPDEVLRLPRLNYERQLSSEPILAQTPDLVLLSLNAGPPSAIKQLKSTGVEVVKFDHPETLEAIPEKIMAVAEVLGIPEEGEKLVQSFQEDLVQFGEKYSTSENSPKVIFLYARQGMGAPLVGGKDSSADVMIKLAGGVNSADSFSDYRPLTPEALVELQPDVILMMDKGLEAAGGMEGLLSVPGMKDTAAGKNRRFVTLPDHELLTFGPRIPQIAEKLYLEFHGVEKEATQE